MRLNIHICNYKKRVGFGDVGFINMNPKKAMKNLIDYSKINDNPDDPIKLVSTKSYKYKSLTVIINTSKEIKILRDIITGKKHGYNERIYDESDVKYGHVNYMFGDGYSIYDLDKLKFIDEISNNKIKYNVLKTIEGKYLYNTYVYDAKKITYKEILNIIRNDFNEYEDNDFYVFKDNKKTIELDRLKKESFIYVDAKDLNKDDVNWLSSKLNMKIDFKCFYEPNYKNQIYWDYQNNINRNEDTDYINYSSAEVEDINRGSTDLEYIKLTKEDRKLFKDYNKKFVEKYSSSAIEEFIMYPIKSKNISEEQQYKFTRKIKKGGKIILKENVDESSIPFWIEIELKDNNF